LIYIISLFFFFLGRVGFDHEPRITLSVFGCMHVVVTDPVSDEISC
jgi:hypothetical protein